MDFLLARYILNDIRRVKRCNKLKLDLKIMGVENMLFDILDFVVPTAYPIPRTILKQNWPQYTELWDKIPDNLNTEEENQSRVLYKRLVKNETIFNSLPKKKENKDYSDEIQQELNDIEDEIGFYSENEKEFKLSDMDKFWEEDSVTVKNIIPTPFDKLTQQLAGGFLPGRLYAFEAPPKSKKSMLMLYIGVWLARLGYKIMYVSTELLDLETRERLFSICRGMMNPVVVGEKKWGEASESDKFELWKFIDTFEGEFHYKFFPSPTMRKVERYLENKPYDLLIIDHASEYRMRPNFSSRDEKKWEIEERVYNDIFTFVRKTMKPVLLPTFLNRAGVENAKKTGKVDMWHSAGAFSKNAIIDAMYAVSPSPAVKDESGRTKQRIDLQPIALRRTGKSGVMEEVIYLEFNGDSALFTQTSVAGDRKDIVTPDSKNWAVEGNK